MGCTGISRESWFITAAVLVFVSNGFILFLGFSQHNLDSVHIGAIFIFTVGTIIVWVLLWRKWNTMVNTTRIFVVAGHITFLADMGAIFLVVDCMPCFQMFWIVAGSLVAFEICLCLFLYYCCGGACFRSGSIGQTSTAAPYQQVPVHDIVDVKIDLSPRSKGGVATSSAAAASAKDAARFTIDPDFEEEIRKTLEEQ